MSGGHLNGNQAKLFVFHCSGGGGEMIHTNKCF